jgi:cytidylate kinase
MAIVTISRGSASGGLLLAEGLAKKLGYQIVGREDVVQKAARLGATEEKLKQAILKPPGFLDRLKHNRRRYLALVQAALCEHLQTDRLIYYGNAGHLLLGGISHVICVRLIAPMAFRIQMMAERQKMSREEAIAYIQKVDVERQKWTQLLYGVDWLDPSLYDLTINLKTLDVSSAVEVAATAAESEEFQPTAQSRQDMANLVLASRVRAALALNPVTSSADVRVKARDGVVFLKGRLRPASLVGAVIDVASGVEGVQGLDREELGAPDYTV